MRRTVVRSACRLDEEEINKEAASTRLLNLIGTGRTAAARQDIESAPETLGSPVDFSALELLRKHATWSARESVSLPETTHTSRDAAP